VTVPLLSVVIPAWNRAHLVCDAIESALGQTVSAERTAVRSGRLVEVIVVDDGSSDGTAGILENRFGSSIHLLRMPGRRGVGPARNAGIARASGDFLAFLDSDDLWLAGKLEAELEVLELFPDAEAVVSDSLTFVEGQRSDRTWFALNGLLEATGGRARWLAECPWLWTDWRNTLAMCSITVRRNVLARLAQPVFAEDLSVGEDWELELRLYQSSRVVVLPRVLSHVRRFDDDTRPGRSLPGKAPTREQEIDSLRDRLKVMERAPCLDGLDARLAAELERCRIYLAEQLAQLSHCE